MAALHYTLLFEHINRYASLSLDDFQLCRASFLYEQHPAHAHLIRTGQVVSKQYFVAQGCLRTYLIDAERDREYTIQFAVEDWWASDFTSYYTGQPAMLHVECLEDTSLLSIEKSELARLYQRLPGLERFFLRKLENAFVAFQKRILANMTKTAEERYDDFLTQYPNIEHRIKNYQIASYLGITPESLSRIRKQRS